MMDRNDGLASARQCLIRSAGWTTQDVGLGRIVGEVLAVVYLNELPSSLDDIGDSLGLSKAAVSIATRQLDKYGLLKRVRNPGDRKTYYRVTDHFAAALQHGILEMVRAKLQGAKEVLDQADRHLEGAGESAEKNFISGQIKRARGIRDRTDKLLNNPLMRFLR
ncbi:MAG: MarR family transcriptional regulator [Victivallales bacterium]|nr:MarR family transcriptional regulator [Victivallales bacterium]